MFSVGGGTGCRWDTSIAGFVIAPRDVFETEQAFLDDVAIELREYTAWANGEVYTVSAVSSDGEVLDAVSGYYGHDGLEAGVDEMSREFSTYVDVSLLKAGSIPLRAKAFGRFMNAFGRWELACAANGLHVSKWREDDYTEVSLFSDIEHAVVARSYITRVLEPDVAYDLVAGSFEELCKVYCEIYMQVVLEEMNNE